jgi:Fe2+ or Zn2+ uptake regulation protein
VCVEECGAVEEVESVEVWKWFHVLVSSSGRRGKNCTVFFYQSPVLAVA